MSEATLAGRMPVILVHNAIWVSLSLRRIELMRMRWRQACGMGTVTVLPVAVSAVAAGSPLIRTTAEFGHAWPETYNGTFTH